MMTHSLPVASKLPIKTLVARELYTNKCIYSIVCICGIVLGVGHIILCCIHIENTAPFSFSNVSSL